MDLAAQGLPVLYVVPEAKMLTAVKEFIAY